MSSFDDMPLESKVTHDIWKEDDDVRKNLLSDIARHIVEEHVDLATEFKPVHLSLMVVIVQVQSFNMHMKC